MKVTVTVIDDTGRAFTGQALLSLENSSHSEGDRQSGLQQAAPNGGKPDFEMPVRPFVKRYAANRGGHQKFTLLLARLANGRVGEPVSLRDLIKSWSKMTGLLGKFNLAYPTRAKDFGYVDSPSKGVYVLLPGWKAALE
jgi:hypothetical protein